jgi:hypothetical protein
MSLGVRTWGNSIGATRSVICAYEGPAGKHLLDVLPTVLVLRPTMDTLLVSAGRRGGPGVPGQEAYLDHYSTCC